MALIMGVSLLACGAPDELSRRDAKALALARERLDDSIDAEETLRTSSAAAKALRGQVRAIVARGVFEKRQLDDAGLAALGELLDGDSEPARQLQAVLAAIALALLVGAIVVLVLIIWSIKRHRNPHFRFESDAPIEVVLAFI